jgi:hypothetical protein
VKARRGHRILLAGNGISPEPYGFAHAGCDVTVVDVSTVACRFVESLEVTTDLLARMFPVYEETDLLCRVRNSEIRKCELNIEKSSLRVGKEQRPGGSLSIVTADLFTFEPEQPFHAIFSRRAYQGLPPDRREELARRFFRWLRPGGLAFVETLNLRGAFKPFEEPFRAAGFRAARQWSTARSRDRRVLFWHGSG